MKIILASRNVHVIREMRDMMKSIPHLEMLTLHNFPTYHSPHENGSTFQSNALLQAEHAASYFNLWAIAEDSGLVVPALKGSPGIFSDCYAGQDSTDLENRRKLLDDMQHLRDLERSAYYECAMVLVSPSGLKKCATGICEGFVHSEERGRYGFSYDSIFRKNDYEKTFAELDENVKNKISHRRKAFDRMLVFLDNLGK